MTLTGDEAGYEWYYGLGKEPERYYGGYTSREETTAAGLKEAADQNWGDLTVVEARHGDIDTDAFDADTVLETLCEHNDDKTDEDGSLGLEDATPAQRRELELALQQALDVWLAKHGLGRVWTFSDVRQKLVMVVPAASATEP